MGTCKKIRVITLILTIIMGLTSGILADFFGNDFSSIFISKVYAEPSSDWIYYLRYAGTTDAVIYKAKVDGTSDVKVLDSSKITTIFVSEDGYIYYLKFGGTSNSVIYREKVDGTGGNRVVLESGINMFFVPGDGYVYYATGMDTSSSKIWRAKVDGTDNDKMIIESGINMFAVPGDGYIYYITSKDTSSSKIWRAKADGTNAAKIILESGISTFSIPGDGYIYFITGVNTSSSKIWRAKVDGTNAAKIVIESGINMFSIPGDGYIYFITGVNTSSSKIWRAKVDGTDNDKIVIESGVNMFSIPGDGYIYYITGINNSSSKIYRAKADGANETRIILDSYINMFSVPGDGYIYYLTEKDSGYSVIHRSKVDGSDYVHDIIDDKGINDYTFYSNKYPITYIVSPLADQVFSETATTYVPSIRVFDGNNDNLSCKIYIGSETTARDTKTVIDTSLEQAVNFNAINIGALSEGSHTLKVEASDGFDTTQTTIGIKVDKTAPTIGTNPMTLSSTATGIIASVISGSVTDSVAGLAPSPYKYTVGTLTNNSWLLPSTPYSQTGLTPNTLYTVKLEAMDNVGHIASKTQNVYTKATTPVFTVANATSTTLEVSTTDANPANTAYQIMTGSSYVTAAGTLTTTPTWITLTGKKVTVTGLTPGTTYTFTATARNAEGVPTSSATKGGATLAVTPVLTVNNPTTNTLDISASDTNPSTTQYQISTGSYYVSSTGTLTTVPTWITLTGKKVTAKGLSANTTYTFTAKAKNSAGVETTSSTAKSGTTLAMIPVLTVGSPTSTTLDISTSDANPSTTQYQISTGSYYVSSTGALTSNSTWITLTGKKVTVTGLSPNTTYTFTAKAKNDAGTETALSTAKSGTTLYLPPAVPTNLTAISTDTAITLSWDSVATAASYEIEATGSVIDTTTSTTYTHSGLTPGTPYTYRIRAVNNGGSSGWSDPITKLTTASSPGVPQITSTIPTSSSIIVTWNEVAGAIGYDIEVDGKVVNNKLNTTYEHTGLLPNIEHTYRVRSRNASSPSAWSGFVTESTLGSIPDTPSNIKVSATYDAITVTWDEVEDADSYDIDIDDSERENVTVTQYVYGGLEPGSRHTFKVRATNDQGESDWSIAVTKSTLSGEPTVPGVPQNFTAEPSDTSIRVIWDRVDGAEDYDVEVDDEIVDNVSVAEYVYGGLEADTDHTFRVRGVNGQGAGEWSEPLMVTTLPGTSDTPQNLRAEVTTHEIRVIWDSVDEAEGYEIEADGEPESVTEAVYTHSGLDSGTLHTYRVRTMLPDDDVSGWSSILTVWTSEKGQIPGIPENLMAESTETSIKIVWDSVEGSESYDIEINGVEAGNVTVTEYVYGGLTPGTTHTFRVRSENEAGESGWSSPLTATTLPNTSGIPTNLRAEAGETSISVAWDAVEGATGYDIEVDGSAVDNGTNTTYMHEGLSPNSSHTYRVRERIGDIPGQWSQVITVNTKEPAYSVECSSGEEFELILTASDVTDFGEASFSLEYNPKELEVLDLCSGTETVDLNTGPVVGTNITITEYTPGRIVFKVDKTVPQGQAWSGVVNYTRFKAKMTGNTGVSYTIN